VTLAAQLLEWYDANRRDLPWRGGRTPYEIWVSEVMLQQTRAETVMGYYEDFLSRFPTHLELAEAPIETVLAAWSGLGYYRRARQLHAAVRELAEQGREIPESPEELRELPGIGEYTAAAIASIAFGAPVAVLDGNVERVLSRLIALPDNPRLAGPKRKLRELANRELDRSRPGDFNQAMMELGATTCLPRAPLCGACPLREGCRGLAEGRSEAYPALPARRKPQREQRRVAVVRRGRKMLVARRSADAELLAGMWELPWVPVAAEEEAGTAEQALAERYGGTWTVESPGGRVRHAMTYRAIEAAVCAGRWREPERETARPQADEIAEATAGPELRFVSGAELAALPTTSLVAKALAALDSAEG
jgi:A/G-specific adenine glycosylase